MDTLLQTNISALLTSTTKKYGYKRPVLSILEKITYHTSPPEQDTMSVLPKQNAKFTTKYQTKKLSVVFSDKLYEAYPPI